MMLVRGTALTGFRELVAERGGDPDRMLCDAGISVDAIGDYGAFISYPGLLEALEQAAIQTGSPDLGRTLASRQSIEVLGSVGAAARSAPTVASALITIERYLRAYTPALVARVVAASDPTLARFEVARTVVGMPTYPQALELTAGVSLQILRHLLGQDWHPLGTDLPHDPLGSVADYETYFGSPVAFGAPMVAFLLPAADLERPLSTDAETHDAMIGYLQTIVPFTPQGVVPVVDALVRRLIPSGSAELSVVADELGMHPRTLQRRLEEVGVTFAELVQTVRRRTAEQYLRDSDMSLRHLASELGYLEQSTFTRACHRWFGMSPLAYRRTLRTPA